MEIQVYVDGGSRGNGSTNDGHGSFAVYLNGQRQTITLKDKPTNQMFLKFENSTSNEAELKTILAAMAYVDEVEIRAERNFSWIFLTDSQIVAGLNNGLPKRSKAQNLKPLYTQVRTWLDSHGDARIEKIKRSKILEVLGH